MSYKDYLRNESDVVHMMCKNLAINSTDLDDMIERAYDSGFNYAKIQLTGHINSLPLDSDIIKKIQAHIDDLSSPNDWMFD